MADSAAAEALQQFRRIMQAQCSKPKYVTAPFTNLESALSHVSPTGIADNTARALVLPNVPSNLRADRLSNIDLLDTPSNSPHTANAMPERNRSKRRVKKRLRNFLCTFPGCDKAFTDNAHLRDHLVVHNGEKRYECSKCDKKFGRPSGLKMHLRNVHGCHKPASAVASSAAILPSNSSNNTASSKNFSCSHCEKSFNSFEELLQQKYSLGDIDLRKQESHSANITCRNSECLNLLALCHKQESTIQLLQAELSELQSNVADSKIAIAKPMPGEPDTKSPASSDLVSSVAITNATVVPVRFLKHEKPFRCEIQHCQKLFSSFYQLRFHAKQHANNSTEEIFGSQTPLPPGPKHCPELGCEFGAQGGKTFNDLHKVKRHWQRSHQTLRPFVCATCGKEFKTNDNLTSHRKQIHDRLTERKRSNFEAYS